MAGSQQQQSSSDSGMGPVWVIVLLFFIGYVLWHEAHTQIVQVIFTLNVWQAKLIYFFTRNDLLAQEIQIMQNMDPGKVEWGQLSLLTRNIGEYLRYPIGLVLFSLAAYLYFSYVSTF